MLIWKRKRKYCLNHLHPIALWFGFIRTSFQVWWSLSKCISFFIASRHSSRYLLCITSSYVLAFSRFYSILRQFDQNSWSSGCYNETQALLPSYLWQTSELPMHYSSKLVAHYDEGIILWQNPIQITSRYYKGLLYSTRYSRWIFTYR